MNYTINISAHSATAFINQADDETEAEFLERAKLAEGKHFMAFQILDKRPNGKAKQFTMQSPYFDMSNEEEQVAIITATFEAIGKAINGNEKIKLTEPPPKEESRLVLPPGFNGRS